MHVALDLFPNIDDGDTPRIGVRPSHSIGDEQLFVLEMQTPNSLINFRCGSLDEILDLGYEIVREARKLQPASPNEEAEPGHELRAIHAEMGNPVG